MSQLCGLYYIDSCWHYALHHCVLRAEISRPCSGPLQVLFPVHSVTVLQVHLMTSVTRTKTAYNTRHSPCVNQRHCFYGNRQGIRLLCLCHNLGTKRNCQQINRRIVGGKFLEPSSIVQKCESSPGVTCSKVTYYVPR